MAALPAMLMVAVAEKARFRGHSVLMATKFNEFKEGHPYEASLSDEFEGIPTTMTAIPLCMTSLRYVDLQRRIYGWRNSAHAEFSSAPSSQK